MYCLVGWLFRCIRIWLNGSPINPSIKIIVIYYLDSNLFLDLFVWGLCVCVCGVAKGLYIVCIFH